MDGHRRTLVKTITWRVIAVFTTIAVVYVYSGDAKESVIVGGAANFLKVFFYYIHERIWNRLQFGRVRAPEYEI